MRKILYINSLILVLFIVVMLIDNIDFSYDAAYYFNLAHSFWDVDGNFSLGNYPIAIRGYVLPLILGVGIKSSVCLFGNMYVFYRLFYCVVAVTMLTVIIPKLIRVEIGTNRWMIGGVINLLIFMFFWKDLLIYPLSDLIALFMYLLSLLFSEKLFLLEKYDCNRPKNMLYSITTGVLMYCAYNIRTVYLVPVMIIMICFVVKILWRREWKKICVIMLMIMGAFLVSIPQISINKNNYDDPTPMVITESYGKDNLFVAQLQWGISMPRYETYVGDVTDYPVPGIRYVSDLGDKISCDEEMSSVVDYVKFVFEHPLEMIGVYFEHLVSGLTLFYNEIYIKDIAIDSRIFLFNFVLWFIGLIGLLSGDKKFRIDNSVWMVGMCFPALLALPGALETRFFLPVYLLLYSYLAFKMNIRAMYMYIRSDVVRSCILFILILMMWGCVANNLLSQLEHVILDFNGNIYLK